MEFLTFHQFNENQSWKESFKNLERYGILYDRTDTTFGEHSPNHYFWFNNFQYLFQPDSNYSDWYIQVIHPETGQEYGNSIMAPRNSIMRLTSAMRHARDMLVTNNPDIEQIAKQNFEKWQLKQQNPDYDQFGFFEEIKYKDFENHVMLSAPSFQDAINLIDLSNNDAKVKEQLKKCLHDLPLRFQTKIYATARRNKGDKSILLQRVGLTDISKYFEELESHFTKWGFNSRIGLTPSYIVISDFDIKTLVGNQNPDFNQMGFFESIKVTDHGMYENIRARGLADCVDLIQQVEHHAGLKQKLIDCLTTLPADYHDFIYAETTEYKNVDLIRVTDPTAQLHKKYLTIVGLQVGSSAVLDHLAQHGFKAQTYLSGLITIEIPSPKKISQEQNPDFDQFGFFEKNIVGWQDFISAL